MEVQACFVFAFYWCKLDCVEVYETAHLQEHLFACPRVVATVLRICSEVYPPSYKSCQQDNQLMDNLYSLTLLLICS